MTMALPKSTADIFLCLYLVLLFHDLKIDEKNRPN